MSIILKGVPMPISINAAYENATVPGQRGRRKTKAYRDYATRVEHWRLENLAQVNSIRKQISQLSHDMVFRMEYAFWFKESSIITKAGHAKRNDTSNRIKVLEDALAPILGIDDSRFWDGQYWKCPMSEDNREEYVNVGIEIMEIMK